MTDQGILCEDKEGKEHLVPGTTVICALGQRSRTDMVEELRDAAPYVAVIGDCGKGIHYYQRSILGIPCGIGYIENRKRSPYKKKLISM